MTRVALVLAVLALAGFALARGSTANVAGGGGCKEVGSISNAMRGSGSLLQLTVKCSCPGSCTLLQTNQSLFATETLVSGKGLIFFNSTSSNVPNFTCQLHSGSKDVLYPNASKPKVKGLIVLKHLLGATSCQVNEGPVRVAHKSNAVFVAGNSQITVKGDPVFGMKTTKTGSLVQVKKGVVGIGVHAGTSVKTVGQGQQVFVAASASNVGDVTALKADPALQKSLCRLTPDLRETDVQQATGGNPGSHPQGLAPDAAGHLWFTDDGATPAVGKYDLATGNVTETSAGLQSGAVPRWIASDAQGAIWFTDDGPTPAIARLDPKTSRITEFSAGLAAGSRPWAIVYNPRDRKLWFTDQSTASPAVGSIDPRTHAIREYRAGLNESSHPEGIEVDKSGDIWFTDDSDHRPAIGTVDLTSHAIRELSKGLVPGSLPRGIAAGPDGNLWFADDRTRPPHNTAKDAPGDGLIGRVDRVSRAIDEFSIADNGGNGNSIPEGLASANGRIWFTDDGTTKAIGVVDPVTGAMAETTTSLAPNSQPVGVVAIKQGLWFTDQLPTPRIGQIKSLPSC